jgi:RHS repeat-associated protein
MWSGTAAGKMTDMPKPGAETTNLHCTYDAWNRLVKVANATGTILAEYDYDGLGRMIETLSNFDTSGNPQSVTHYYYAGDQLIETRHAAALPNRTAGTNLPENLSPHYQYVWSAVDPNAPILRDDLSTGSTAPRLYYLTDANDNVTALVAYDQTAGNWQVKERYVYDAYGNVTVYNATWSTSLGGYAASAVGNTVLFGGLQVAPLTGLYRAAARWYNPSTGDWMSRDQAQSDANLYRYVDDDPISLQDPSGLAVGGGGPWTAPGQPATPQPPPPGSNCSIVADSWGDVPASGEYEVCFAAGTRVLMADGTSKPIEEVQAGEMVLSAPEHDPEGKPEPKPVVQVYHNRPRGLLEVRVVGCAETAGAPCWPKEAAATREAGSRASAGCATALAEAQAAVVVRVTPNHPIYARSRGFTAARDLRPGDELLSDNGDWVTVGGTSDLGVVERVYNLQVADHHTYFVGTRDGGRSVLAHNVSLMPPAIRAPDAAPTNDWIGDYPTVDAARSGIARMQPNYPKYDFRTYAVLARMDDGPPFTIYRVMAVYRRPPPPSVLDQILAGGDLAGLVNPIGVLGAFERAAGAAAKGSQEAARAAQAAQAAARAAEAAGCAGGPGGESLNAIQKAMNAFRSNGQFRSWFHKVYKTKMNIPGGGVNNPDLSSEAIREAYEEWIASGKPGT